MKYFKAKSHLVNHLAVLNDVKALRKRRIREVGSIVHGINLVVNWNWNDNHLAPNFEKFNQNFAAIESLASLLSEGGSSLQPDVNIYFRFIRSARCIQYIVTPVLNIGVAVNVIVASLPPNFKVAPLRWMGLAISFYKRWRPSWWSWYRWALI